MTAAMFLLAATFVVSTAGILDLRRDARHERDRVEVERITAPLPAVLKDLTGEWPVRQSPTDMVASGQLPALYHSRPVPEMTWLTTGYLEPRQYTPWPEIRDRLVKERRELESGWRERILRQPTEAFNEIIEASWPITDWCDSCRVGWDGERHHQSCPGCPCPCGVVAEVSHVA
jgi:hypothetical protein